MRGFDASQKKVYDIESCAHLMVKDFFDGRLGKAMFDDPLEEKADIDLEKFV